MLILSIERHGCVLLSPLQIHGVIVRTCALYQCLLILPVIAGQACQYTCTSSVRVPLLIPTQLYDIWHDQGTSK